MSQPLPLPARTIRDAKRVCDPFEPLPEGDPRWQDFSSVRGPHVERRIFDKLETAQSTGKYMPIVLGGHRGSGKSSELNRVKERAQRQGFFVIDTRMDEQLDPSDADYADFILVVTRLLEERLRASGIELPRETLNLIARWYQEVTEIKDNEIAASLDATAEAKLGAEIPFLAKLMTALTSQVKSSETRRTEIRSRVQKYAETLVSHVNLLLDDVHKALLVRNQHLLMIFDNVDRLDPKAATEVLIKGSDKLARIKAHVIYTVPIGLLYGEREPIADRFQEETLPMIPIYHRGRIPNEPAIGLMLTALAKRISIPDVFADPALAREVVLRSGGCLRDMLHIMNETLAETTGDKIDRMAFERGCQIRRTNFFLRHILAEDYPRLAECHRHNKVTNDDAHRRLLFQRAILEYDTQAWWDVHPLITQIREFQDEFSKLAGQ